METSIVIAGFGGQGALFAGQLLAYAAMQQEKEVTWLPSYGPEMRGGTAHCTVVIGDEPIASPLVRQPDCVVALNLPSADKYEQLVKAGGLFVVNSSLVTRPLTRHDVTTIPANELAEKAGDLRVANLVMLGALIAVSGVLPLAAIEEALESWLPERHRALLATNRRALHEGAIYVTTLAPSSALPEGGVGGLTQLSLGAPASCRTQRVPAPGTAAFPTA
jgi:2-oxoglutarate ferredoxin oxidoreductase subunit gamma